MNPMFDKLKKIEDRYEFLTAEISRPDIIADNSVWKKLVKEHSGLQDVVNVYREWKRADDNLTMSIAALETEKDKEMSQLLHEEIGVLKTQKEELEQRLKVLLLPVDPNDEKNVIVEIHIINKLVKVGVSINVILSRQHRRVIAIHILSVLHIMLRKKPTKLFQRLIDNSFEQVIFIFKEEIQRTGRHVRVITDIL